MFTTCTVKVRFEEESPICGMPPRNGDGFRPITLTKLRSVEERITFAFAERFLEISERESSSHLPCIWAVRMLANAACCPNIRFINPILRNPSTPHIFHVERVPEGQPRQETIFYHQCGPLSYLLPVEKPDAVLTLTPASINQWPLLSRTLTCCLHDAELKGVAITLEKEQTTILWLKA